MWGGSERGVKGKSCIYLTSEGHSGMDASHWTKELIGGLQVNNYHPSGQPERHFRPRFPWHYWSCKFSTHLHQHPPPLLITPTHNIHVIWCRFLPVQENGGGQTTLVGLERLLSGVFLILSQFIGFTVIIYVGWSEELCCCIQWKLRRQG